MNPIKKEGYPLGFKFPRRVKVIAKRINLPVLELVTLLKERGVKCSGSTYLNNHQLIKIKDLVEASYSKRSGKKKWSKSESGRLEMTSRYDQIEDIKNRIRILESKMRSKTISKVRGRVIKKSIPSHLRKYYIEEIKKLNLALENISLNENKRVFIEWEQIIFDDYEFRVCFENGTTFPYSFKDSRRSFNHLSNYFRKVGLQPLECILNGKKIVEIINVEEIYKAVQIVRINGIYVNFNEWDGAGLKQHLQKLQNSFSRFLIKNKKNRFLKYLASIHSSAYKIVPVFEGNSEEGDSFLFTLKNENKITIIWESCTINKATYIFRTSKSEYFSSLLYLITVIQSEDIQRMDIRKTLVEDKKGNLAGDFLYHDEFHVWKNRLHLMTE